MGVFSAFRDWLAGTPASGPNAVRRLAGKLVIAETDELPRLLQTLLAFPAAEVEEAIVAECAFMEGGAAQELAATNITLVRWAHESGIEHALKQRDEEIERAARGVHALTGAHSPLEMRWVIEEHPSLLTYKSARALQALAKRSSDQAFRHNAKVYLQVLEDCRKRGVAAVIPYEGLKLPELELIPSDDWLIQLLNTEWDESMAELLAEHPGFLDLRFDKFLRFSALQSPSEQFIVKIGVLGARLARCRDIGVAAALQERWHMGMMPGEPPESVLLFHSEDKSPGEVLKYLLDDPEAAEYHARWNAQGECLDWITTPPSWPLAGNRYRLTVIALGLLHGRNPDAAAAIAMGLAEEIDAGESPFARGYLHYVAGSQLANGIRDASPELLHKALEHLESALEVYTTDFPLRHARVQSLIASVKLEFFRQGNAKAGDEALRALKIAIDLTSDRESPQGHGAYLYDYARALMSTKKSFDETLAALQCAERFLAQTPSLFGLHPKVLSQLANFLADHGRWSEAREPVRKEIDIVEKQYAEDLFTRGRDQQIRSLNPAYRLAAYCAAQEGDLQEALALLERGRGRRFRDALPLRLTRTGGVSDEAWSTYETMTEYLQSLGDLKDLDLEGMLDDPAAWSEKHLKKREKAYQAIEGNSELAPFIQRLLDPPSNADIDAVLAAHNAALLSFVIARQGTVAIIQQHEQEPRSVNLPEFGLRRAAELAATFLVAQQSGPSNIDTAIDNTISEIGKSLFDPLLDVLGDQARRLIIIPPGLLGLLPLDLARIHAGAHLRDRYTITYASSLALLVESHRRAQATRPHSLLAVVNPQDDPQLVFASVEGERVSQYFDNHRTLSADVTIGDITSGIRDRGYLHWIGHGVFEFENPEESGLLLAEEERLRIEELWTRRIDVSQLRMATLSTCQSGITDVTSADPDEALGLPAMFMLAGVPCVLASLWPVSDMATAILMEAFYAAHLAQKMSPGEALRTAQDQLRTTTSADIRAYAKRVSHPATETLIADTLEREGLNDLGDDECPFAAPLWWAGFFINGL